MTGKHANADARTMSGNARESMTRSKVLLAEINRFLSRHDTFRESCKSALFACSHPVEPDVNRARGGAPVLRIELDPARSESQRLLRLLTVFMWSAEVCREVRDDAVTCARALTELLPQTRVAASRIRMSLHSRRAREQAEDAARQVSELLAWAMSGCVAERVQEAERRLAMVPDDGAVLTDFGSSPGSYRAALSAFAAEFAQLRIEAFFEPSTAERLQRAGRQADDTVAVLHAAADNVRTTLDRLCRRAGRDLLDAVFLRPGDELSDRLLPALGPWVLLGADPGLMVARLTETQRRLSPLEDARTSSATHIALATPLDAPEYGLGEMTHWTLPDDVSHVIAAIRADFGDRAGTEEHPSTWSRFDDRRTFWVDRLARLTGRTLGSLDRAASSRVAALRLHAEDLLAAEDVFSGYVKDAFVLVRDEMVRANLSRIQVERLKDVTEARLPVRALERAGLTSINDVLKRARDPGTNSAVDRLSRIPGVSTSAAAHVVAAAEQVERAVRDDLKFRIDLDPENARSTRLLQLLYSFDHLNRTLELHREESRAAVGELTPLASLEVPIGAYLLHDRGGLAQGSHPLEVWAEQTELADVLAATHEAVLGAEPEPDTVWRDFQQRAAEYYGLLGEVVDLQIDVAAAAGFIPEAIARQVNAQELDTEFLRASLRGYQAFGARFALVQRRAIVGDEMGLGKTVQALAVMAHLGARGTASHFLVVCPASVLVNWIREVSDKTRLRPYRLHGLERRQQLGQWLEHGGVGVTTFDTLSALRFPATMAVGVFVVDEAHFVKNPRAKRSQAVARLADGTERVLFLTGTPMENRVEEFRRLVDYLNPELAAEIDGADAVAGPDTFRRSLAPVYLRRNQVDVLTELPDLIQVEEWEEFGAQDGAAYRQAVRTGNFMAMRKAAFGAGHLEGSAKLRRLVEIAEEARTSCEKVIVFSYFRDVVDTVCRALQPHSFEPIVGATSTDKRQRIIDRYAATEGHAVLVCQIQAGGVGTNLQAGSIVILCEPQVKPSLEIQAIARAHRMGQVRKVQVHRLLIADSVDQRMLEILHAKEQLFDQYVRRSSLAEAARGAVDISEAELAQRVVAAEQERLAHELMTAESERAGATATADGM